MLGIAEVPTDRDFCLLSHNINFSVSLLAMVKDSLYIVLNLMIFVFP